MIFKDGVFGKMIQDDLSIAAGFVLGMLDGLELQDPVSGLKRGGAMLNMALYARFANRARKSQSPSACPPNSAKVLSCCVDKTSWTVSWLACQIAS